MVRAGRCRVRSQTQGASVRILVAEDYAPLRAAVVQGLCEAGYAVDEAGDGEEARWYAQGGDYDVLILDLMLPKVDGLSLLRELRDSGQQLQVLVLTARDTIEDRVLGLNLGADDYLVKPFAFAELLARIGVLVRRRYGQRAPVLTVGHLRVDTVARSAWCGDTQLDLTAREYALLEYLTLRAGQTVTREEIREHLYDFAAEPGSNVIDVYVGYLRHKLERDGRPRLLHTRRGLGYVLAGAA